MTDMTPTLPPLPTLKRKKWPFDSEVQYTHEEVRSYATEYGEQCARAAVAQQAEVTCRHCNGSGEAPYLSGGGPDAYDVTGPCATCKGTGAVATPPAVEARVPDGWVLERIDANRIRISWDGGGLVADKAGKNNSLVNGVALYALADAMLSAAPAAPQAEPEQRTREKIEQLKFDIRQAMIEYGSAYKAGHDNGIKETSERGCRLIDEFAAAALGRAVAEPGWFSVKLAEMILSDCGHSTDYTPLLNKVAARIEKHVEEILSATQPPTQQASEQPLLKRAHDLLVKAYPDDHYWPALHAILDIRKHLGMPLAAPQQAQQASAQPTQAAKDVLTDEKIMQFLAPWHVHGDEQDRKDLIASVRAMLSTPEAAP